jgi:hypothetical protein
MTNSIFIVPIITLAAITGILYLVLYLVKRFSNNSKIFTSPENIIKINSVAYLDSNSKIVNLSCSNKKYLILVGKNNDLLIDKYE